MMSVKQQVVVTISAILNLYWDLVTFNDAVRIKEQALATAQKLLQDNQKQVKAGALPTVELTRAAAAVSSSKEDLLFAQTNVAQQEIVLKNALSRNAIQNAWLDDVHIVPLDHIDIPKTDELKAVPELIEEALANRIEIDQAKLNLQSQEIMLKGDKNGLLPSMQAFADVSNNGLSGVGQPALQRPERRSQSVLHRRRIQRGRRSFCAAISPIIPPGFQSPFPSATARRRPIRSPMN